MSTVALPGAPTGIEWSATYLRVVDPSLPFETCAGIFQTASALGDAARWIMGDLLLFAESRYGELYAQLLDSGRVSERQLSRYRYVCERVRISRRRENLSFSHHEEVAPLESDAQARVLDIAATEGWTAAQVRDHVRSLRAVPPATGNGAQPKQEVLWVAAVDAVRNLSEAKETLERIGAGLDEETSEAVGVPRAIRAINEAGETVRKAAERVEAPSLRDLGRKLVSGATRSSGFAMIPLAVFEEFAAAVAAVDREERV